MTDDPDMKVVLGWASHFWFGEKTIGASDDEEGSESEPAGTDHNPRPVRASQAAIVPPNGVAITFMPTNMVPSGDNAHG